MPTNELAHLLAQMNAPQDERTKLLLQLAEQHAARADPSEDEAHIRRAHRKRRLERQALAFLQQKNLELSSAFGACACWGERPSCPSCGGQGQPGWQAPDEELFLLYVEPTLQRLGLLADDDSEAYEN